MVGPQDVLDFWFGTLDEEGRADAEQKKKWWTKDPAFDAEIRERFGDTYTALVAGKTAEWASDPRGLLACAIVLDQFSRNMFRGSGEMYRADGLALQLARTAVETGQDKQLRCDERVFLYMPFMHAEEREAQNECVELFKALAAEHASTAGNVDYAVVHRDIVEKFGRFPHRNELVARETTAEEQTFLDEGGPTF